MRNGYINDTLISVEICENIKMVGKVVEIYEAAIDQENFEKSPIRENIGKLFA